MDEMKKCKPGPCDLAVIGDEPTYTVYLCRKCGDITRVDKDPKTKLMEKLLKLLEKYENK